MKPWMTEAIGTQKVVLAVVGRPGSLGDIGEVLHARQVVQAGKIALLEQFERGVERAAGDEVACACPHRAWHSSAALYSVGARRREHDLDAGILGFESRDDLFLPDRQVVVTPAFDGQRDVRAWASPAVPRMLVARSSVFIVLLVILFSCCTLLSVVNESRALNESRTALSIPKAPDAVSVGCFRARFKAFSVFSAPAAKQDRRFNGTRWHRAAALHHRDRRQCNRNDPRSPSPQFDVVGLQIDHMAVMHMTEMNAISVDNRLRAIFWAVPAPMRVEPEIISAGVSSMIATSAPRTAEHPDCWQCRRP